MATKKKAAPKKKTTSKKKTTTKATTPAERPGLFSALPKNVSDVLDAQYGLNQLSTQQEAKLNRFAEKTPFGSRKWTYDAEGNPTAEVELSPYEQQKYDQQNIAEKARWDMVNSQGGLQEQVRNAYSSPLNFSDIPSLPSQEDLFGSRLRAENSLYNRYTSRFKPVFVQEEEEFRQRMANEGIAEGSEKYARNFQQLKQAQNDAYADAQGRATEGGLAEQDRYWNQALQGRQTRINEKMQLRDNPYSDLTRVLSLQSAPVQSQYSAITPIGYDPIDVAGTAANYAGFENSKSIAAANNKAAQAQARLAGEYSLRNASINANAGLREQELRNQNALDQINLQNSNKPKSANPFAQAGINILSGAGASFLGGLFGGNK